MSHSVNEGKISKNDNKKNTTIIITDEEMMAPFVKVKECKHVANNDVTWVLDSETSQLPPYYSYKGIVSYLKSKRLQYYLMDFFWLSVENCGN